MNIRSSKINVAFDSKLNLTRNKAEITQFNGFEIKNSPIYGSSLSPLWTKEEEISQYSVFDSSGNKYYVKDHILYKNDDPIMKTKGDSYFEISSNTERGQWDTYDIDNDNILKSKYEHGVITYYYNDEEYTYTVSSLANATIDCRSRIVNGMPITAYVMATPVQDQYQFIFLSKNIQQSYIGTTNNKILRSSQVLSATTAGSGTFFQNRSTSISTSLANNRGNKGFLNPLIQICSPIDNVYAVSFYTNHGGKINPETDLEYYNIIYNNGTFYNEATWNTTSSQVEIPHEQTFSITSTPILTKESSTGTCYAYEIPSGDADYDAKHKNDVGKYFLTIDRYGNLQDEIFFDAEYQPTWQSTSMGVNADSVQYITYQTFKYESSDDILNIENEVSGLTTGDSVRLDLEYTPKIKKHSALEEISTDYKLPIENNTLLYSDEIQYKKKLIANTGTNTSLYEDNNKTSYKYKALYNIDGDLIKSDYKIKITTNAYNEHLWWDLYIPESIVRRDTNSGAAGRDYELYPVMYGEEQAYHEATIGEQYEGVTLQTEEDLYELDENGNKIQIDYEYWYKLYGHELYYPLDSGREDKPTYQTLEYYEGNQIVTDKELNVQLLIDYYEIVPYVYWEQGETSTFTSTLNSKTPTSTWTFTYKNNNQDWDADILWGGFNNTVKAAVTLVSTSGEEDVGKINVSGAPIQLTKIYTWVTYQSVTQIMTPTAFLDDGTAISTAAITRRAVLPVSNILSYHGRITSVSNNRFSFNSIGYYNTQNASQLGTALTYSIDLNSNYFRSILSLANGTNSTAGTIYGMQILYDCANNGATLCNAGGLSADTTTGSGWITALWFNNQGSISKAYGKWRYLINSAGLVSGLSYGEEGYIGTLLTEWNSISEDKYVYFDENKIGWLSTDGKWYEVTLKEGENENINIIFDRYILVQTNGFWNAYDIERQQPLHYASDFNNRAYAGVSSLQYSDYVNIGRNNSTGHSLAKFFVSGINSLYEVSNVALTSIQISPQAYINIATGYETFPWCKSDNEYAPQYIEIFAGINTDATSATYQYSVTLYEVTSVTLKDSSLVGLNSPVAIAASTQYSPNIFTEFIHTYNNKDLVKNGQYGYPIVYNETTPILSYASGKQISNVDAVFVIQSQFYALINGKIVSVTYDDWTIIGIDAIIDISGMKYLGYLPTKAYFWSPANRCLYSFTGDANLSIEIEANAISEVYNTYYSTQKEALFITTDIGTLVISDLQTYLINTGKVDKIWFINDGYFITENEQRLKYFSYEKNLIPDCVKLPIELETEYYGPANGQVITCDKVSIIIRTDELIPGDISLYSSTLTDSGYKSDYKTIKITADKWDKLTKSLVINYTPKYAQGQGIKIGLKSDFNICRMTESITELVQNTSSKNTL